MTTPRLPRPPGKSRDVTAGKIVPRVWKPMKIRDEAHLADDAFFDLVMIVNHKKVHRIMRMHRHPRVEHRKSMAASPNQRWATASPPGAEVTMAGVPLCRLLIAARVKISAGNWLTPPVPKLPSVR